MTRMAASLLATLVMMPAAFGANFPEVEAYTQSVSQVIAELSTTNQAGVAALESSFRTNHNAVAESLRAVRERVAATYQNAISLAEGEEDVTLVALTDARQADLDRAYGILAMRFFIDDGVTFPEYADLAVRALTNAVATTLSADQRLHPIYQASLSEVVPPYLVMEVDAPVGAAPGEAVPLRVHLRNAGDEPTEEIILKLSEASDDSGAVQSISLPPLAGQGAVLHTFNVLIPDDVSVAAFMLTAASGNTSGSADVIPINVEEAGP